MPVTASGRGGTPPPPSPPFRREPPTPGDQRRPGRERAAFATLVTLSALLAAPGCVGLAHSIAASSGSPAARVGGVVRPGDLPAFEDPVLAALARRFIADKTAWDADPEGAFPTTDGNSTCDLSAGRAEELLLGMPREKFLAVVRQGGMEARITAISWRVLEGSCPEGLLQGRVRFRADYTMRGSSRSGPALETVSTSRLSLTGMFANGAPEGELASLLHNDTSITGGVKSRSEIRTFEYRTLRGKELAGPSATFRLLPDAPVGIQTVVKSPLEPGLVSADVYDGPSLVSRFFEQDGLSHGEWKLFARKGLAEQRSCYNAGVQVAAEACAGPQVDLERAIPIDPMGRPLVVATVPRPSAAGARAPTPAAVAPTLPPAALPGEARALPEATASPWPDLAGVMRQIGGGEKDVAVIVGVENYAFVPKVPGAGKNAKDWYRYFTRVRKTSPGRVRLLLDNDATDVGFKTAVAEAAELATEGGTLWFVFVGHGAPSADQSDGLLVGVDAQQSAQGLYARSVAQRELVRLAGKGRQSRTVFVLDACFSGRTGAGAALASGLQPLLPVVRKAPAPAGVLVFTAGRADQFAGPLPRLDRPAFSYLLLGGLLGWSDADRDGRVGSLELADFTADTLRAVLNGRSQTPELSPRIDVSLAGSAGAPGPDVAGIAVGD